MRSPLRVLVAAIRLTITARLDNGLLRQFIVMYENMRCSILFHLLVPGGKWQTLTLRPTLSANLWSDHFHSRLRALLLPPESAVINNEVAFGVSGGERVSQSGGAS